MGRNMDIVKEYKHQDREKGYCDIVKEYKHQDREKEHRYCEGI